MFKLIDPFWLGFGAGAISVLFLLLAVAWFLALLLPLPTQYPPVYVGDGKPIDAEKEGIRKSVS